ncbi:hypothetical protein GE09DRAFT_447689 [Coniochaeta sp. 2T2.1]|nr:hypothetical protein GE09DRAFT_447689 [Coniochaeta sp. 2T2.1]
MTTPTTSKNPTSSSSQITFPPSLNLYLTSRLAILAQSTFHLGPDRRSPLHSVTTHQGFSGAPDVVLHTSSSSSKSSPVLATAEFETPFSEEMVLTLYLSPNTNSNKRVITMTSTARPAKDWGRRDWFYSVPEGTGGGKGEYVWRHIDGEEDDDDGGKGYQSGWNLLRRRGQEEEEVVAFYAYPAMTMTKKMAFRFVEGGAGGGERKVAGRWAVAAVVSALGIWELERRRVAATGSMMGVA